MYTERENTKAKTEETTMTEKTRKQIEAMKQQTIGVEIEMAKITREKACRTVAKFFGTDANGRSPTTAASAETERS